MFCLLWALTTSVDQLCTVLTNCTQGLQTAHRVNKLCTVSTNCTVSTRLQHVHSVYNSYTIYKIYLTFLISFTRDDMHIHSVHQLCGISTKLHTVSTLECPVHKCPSGAVPTPCARFPLSTPVGPFQ